MRNIPPDEVRRRGCVDCFYVKHPKDLRDVTYDRPGDLTRYMCNYERCPFNELDHIKHDYIKEYDLPLQQAFREHMKKILILY